MDNPYPVILNLKNKLVVIVGGGKTAARKIKGLIKTGAKVVVVSPELNPEIDQKKVNWKPKKYSKDDLRGANLVIVCTNDSVINQQVTKDASNKQLVNNTGEKKLSDFYNVAKIENKHLLFTIFTKGGSPIWAKKIKKQLSKWLVKQKWFY